MIDKAAEIAEETARLRRRAEAASRSLRRVLCEAEVLCEQARRAASGSYEGEGWRRVNLASREASAFAGTLRGAVGVLDRRGNP